MSFPIDPTTPSGGKPVRPDSLDSMVIQLQRKVEALERALALISRPDGGLVLATGQVNANGIPLVSILTVDSSGNPVWTINVPAR